MRFERADQHDSSSGRAEDRPVNNRSVVPTLLLVDDTDANLLALEAILGERYHFIRAHSGKQALRIALQEPIDVVLLDVVMPGMDGFEVARNLKLIERTREAPILFLTATAADLEQISRAYDAGAVDYLVKPLEPDLVRRRVAVFVDLVQQRKEIARQAAELRDRERREFELQIAELRIAGDRRYRKLVEGIDHAIGWTADETFRLTFVSRQAPRILGFPIEEFSDEQFWAKRLHPEDRERMFELFRGALADGSELVADHRLVDADGRTRWFHTGVSGEPRTPNAPGELHGISVDVTDLKHAQEEAQRATHVREELLAIVAHDLRSPLGAIRMSAGLLERVASGAGEVRVQTSAQTIKRSADRMERLINDLLDFALIQAERVTIERGTVSAAELVGESLEAYQEKAAEKQLRISSAVEPGLRVHGDRGRLIQVLSNLIGNAVKFTPESGAITLRADRTGNAVTFLVADTGPGIPPEDQAHIWDRYWQSKRRGDGGVGLGLSIARGFVEAHRGRIWAESEVGRGTKVFFTIPDDNGEAVAKTPPPDDGRRPEA